MAAKKGKGQRTKGKGQSKTNGQGARGKGKKKIKGQGSGVRGKKVTKKKIRKTKKAVKKAKQKSPPPPDNPPVSPFSKGGQRGISKGVRGGIKSVKTKTPKKPVSKAKSLALPKRADMVSAMVGEFKRDIMVVPGKCNACADMGGPQCVEACRNAIAYQHKEVKPIPRIIIKKSQGFNIPMLCHNCEEAPCMSACMTGTRRRLPETGWVETDYNRCVGCWMCVMVCPFGAIIRSEAEHLARKCDGCTSYKTAPCVSACRPGAIVQTGAYSYDYEKRKDYAERLGYEQHLLNTTKK